MTARWDGRVARLAARLGNSPPGPGLRLRLPGGAAPQPSAVLIALLPPATLVLTERGAQLSAHAGQVSFPGGKAEESDADLLHTAWREAREEVGLERAAFEPLGALTPVPTPSGFLIHPFVARWNGRGAVPEPTALTEEVAAVVLAPLAELTRAGVHAVRLRDWQGRTLESHEFELPELERPGGCRQPAARIWGATGRITRELLELSGG